MMSEALNTFNIRHIEAKLSKAEASFYKLLLVVGKSGTGKTTLLRYISKEMQIPLINLGLILSRKLLNLTIRQRKLKVAEIIDDILREVDAPKLAVDNTEIIFDPNLKINPLGLLRSISKTRSLIWSWNGELNGDYLVYAYPGHPEYHRIAANEFITISL